jgi:outer membrane protein TolC
MGRIPSGWKRLRSRAVGSVAAAILWPLAQGPALAQETQAPPTAAAAAHPLRLEECLQIAHDQQPALIAERATLASANTQYDALQRLHSLGIIIGRDLPIRRIQACKGIHIAEAGLDQAEWETAYAVTRTYYGVIFARHQLRVAKDVATSFQFYHDRVKDLVKAGSDRNLNTSSLDKITLYLRLAETRQAEASRGIERATSALREAMGVCLDFPLAVPDDPLPHPKVAINKEEIIYLALARRGELAQASTVAEVVDLEAKAQDKSFMPVARTFAAVSDIHARPIPLGISNGEYRPGATGIDMPTALAGPRSSRVDRAHDLGARADAVVNKTHNLIALEAEDAYLKWEEADRKIPQTKDAAEAGARLSKNAHDDFGAGQNVKIDEILMAEVLAGQAKASYNEALYQQLIALAGLQRVTAGGYNPGLTAH